MPDVLNSGFEVAGERVAYGGWDLFDAWYSVSNDGAISDETSVVHAGGHAAKLTSGPWLNTWIEQDIVVAEETAYTLSFWTRGDGSGAVGQCWISNLNQLVGDFFALLSLIETPRTATPGVVGTTYIQITEQFTTPPGCTSIRVGFISPSSNNASIYIDDVALAGALTGITAMYRGVSLTAIERAVARRLGPYRQDVVSSASTTSITVTALASSIERGDIADAYLLRRGLMAGDTELPFTLNQSDKQRIVKSYIPETGELFPDTPWANAPLPGELIELHALDPEQELRPAVLQGLARCYRAIDTDVTFQDTNPLRKDVTAVLPWVTEPEQIYEVQYLFGVSWFTEVVLNWRARTGLSGHVMLELDPFMPATYRITCRQSVRSDVAGIPTNTSVYNVDLEYAAAAGHVEAWRNCSYRLVPLVRAGLYPSQEAAASEFTRAARQHFRPVKRRQMLGEWL